MVSKNSQPTLPKHFGWEYKTRKPLSLAVTLRFNRTTRIVILVHSEQLQLQTTVIMKLVWMCYLSLEMEDVNISNE